MSPQTSPSFLSPAAPWIGVLGCVPAALALLGGCSQPNKYEAPPPPEVTVSRPVQRDVTDWAEFTGLLEESARVDIQARVEGYLDEVHFIEGQQVEKDQLLYRLDQRPFQAALDKAKANQSAAESRYTDAQKEFERYEKLYADKVISESDLDQRRVARDSAREMVNVTKAAVIDAELNLAYTEIKSPMEGRIGRNNVDPGNVAGPTRGVLTTIVVYDPMNLIFNITERDLLRLRPKPEDRMKPAEGSPRIPVFLGLSTDTGFPYKGRLDFADLGVDPQTGNFRMRASFENADRDLIPGLFARVRVPVAARPGALLVAEQAIGQDQSGYFVLKIGPENEVIKQAVRTGALQEDKLRVIENGLTPEDRVVVNGVQRARPGAKVSPKEGAMPRLIIPDVLPPPLTTSHDAGTTPRSTTRPTQP